MIEPAEAACRRAVEINDEILNQDPAAIDQQVNLAASLSSLGSVLRDAGRSVDAEAACRRAVDVREKLVQRQENSEYIDGLAASVTVLGTVLHQAGQSAQAEEAFRRAVTLRDKLVAEHEGHATYNLGLASSLTSLAALLVLRAIPNCFILKQTWLRVQAGVKPRM